MSSPRTFGVIPITFFYKTGRATALSRAFFRFWAEWASIGLPALRQRGLEGKGRGTGRPHTLAVVMAGHQGQQHLLSMLGKCEWVKIERAQSEVYLIIGRRHKMRLEEVPVEGRACVWPALQ